MIESVSRPYCLTHKMYILFCRSLNNFQFSFASRASQPHTHTVTLRSAQFLDGLPANVHAEHVQLPTLIFFVLCVRLFHVSIFVGKSTVQSNCVRSDFFLLVRARFMHTHSAHGHYTYIYCFMAMSHVASVHINQIYPLSLSLPLCTPLASSVFFILLLTRAMMTMRVISTTTQPIHTHQTH